VLNTLEYYDRLHPYLDLSWSRNHCAVLVCCLQTLTITNISDKKVIFKVKTSQPTWYLVRPNQHVIDVGKTESVTIALSETEKRSPVLFLLSV
jgi:hypothetical protein